MTISHTHTFTFLEPFNRSLEFGQHVTNSDLMKMGGGVYSCLTVQSFANGYEYNEGITTLVGRHPGMYVCFVATASVSHNRADFGLHFSGFDSLLIL